MDTSGGSQNLNPYAGGQPGQGFNSGGGQVGQDTNPNSFGQAQQGWTGQNQNIQAQIAGGVQTQQGVVMSDTANWGTAGQPVPQDYGQPPAQIPVEGQQLPAVQPQIQSDGQIPAVTQPQPFAAPIEPEQGMPSMPAGAKEAEYVGGGGLKISEENLPIIEVKEPGELPEEVEGWIERTEHDQVRDFKPVVHEGQTLVTTPSAQMPGVTLPLTDEEMKKGVHQKVFESVRWMAEWCLKMIKKYHGKVAYGNQEVKKHN